MGRRGRRVTVQHRRQLVVQRHDLAGGAASPRHVVRHVLALHATDPASVYLSVLARSAATAIDDVADAMYRRQVLVRWMAMRRTLFVLDSRDVPLVHAAVGAAVGESLRRSLVARVERCGTEPPLTGDVASWLARLEAEVETLVAQRGSATGAELAVAVPALRTRITARAPSDRPGTLTTSLLTELAASGRLVRGNPRGAWTSRTHDWQPVGARWPHGIPHPDPDDARQQLAHRWLERFGPATAEDLQWWTGWSKTTTGRALAGLRLEPVDLHGVAGLDLLDRPEQPVEDEATPTATLLPALDPTPMGWRHRDWLFGTDPAPFFDRAGNIGPTLWLDGRIVGGWATTAAGEVVVDVRADCGREAHAAIDAQAARLQARLAGAVIVPAARTPLEPALVNGERSRSRPSVS